MKWIVPIVVLGGMVGCGSMPDGPAAEMRLAAVRLRCEYGEEPLGVDVARPRLFWQLQGEGRDRRQSAYRVLVASSRENLAEGRGDLWDSGKVRSDRTTHIRYGGRELRSSQQAFWKVRVWDEEGRASAWSAPASWTMGVLREWDWGASWIGGKDANWPTVMLRREFWVRPGLKRAVAHVCGLGHYEMSLNGRKVGQDLLSPGWSKYDKTSLYDTHEITPMLREGANAVGLVLGNGMFNVKGGRYHKFIGSYGAIRAIAQIRLEYGDGTVEQVGTDERWRGQAGPITFCCIYGGEDYDARLEPGGWDGPGFDDGRWPAAVRVGSPGGKLRGYCWSASPIRAFETLRPVRVSELSPGVAVYDLGQNVSLIPRLVVRGGAGSSVRVIPGELLRPDGAVDRRSCGGGEAYWKYTLAGRGIETFQPRFFYHGCRYVQVECTAGAEGGRPVVESLEAAVVHSSSPAVGEFECSSELFNRIHALVRWAQRSNMFSVLTDCPHRERLGWLEEYHLNGPSLRYEFDLNRLFTKAMTDMADSQLGNGLVPDIAPEYTVFSGGFRDSPEWGSAYVLAPWQQYQWSGDLDLLREHYAGMKRYVAYLKSTAKEEIVSHGLGDWCDVGPKPPGVAQLTPPALTATAFYYLDTKVLAETAKLLGHGEDAVRYEAAAERIRRAFNRTFHKADSGQYATGSQCANAIPLVMGIAEAEHRSAALEAIVKDVRDRGNAQTAGDVGYRYLLRALADGGRSDVIFDINNQSEKPGYGYQLRKGATSLVESWDARPETSQNHFMLGHIVEWLYHDLAGIGCDPEGPGFRKIIIRPNPVGDLKWLRASHESIHGRIRSAWKIEEGAFELVVSIPANTSATVYVPGQAVLADEASRLVGQEGGRAVYGVGSGQYVFRSRIVRPGP